MEFKQESIFVSGIRSFFKCFAGLFGLLFALVCIIVIVILATPPSLSPKGTDITILPDAKGNHLLLPESTPVILQISIEGVIGADKITGQSFEQILMDSRENFLKNDRVKAILLHINTPGGTVDDADTIYRALLAYKQEFHVPVYAYVNGLCASGGMYIAAAADKIYASPPSIIGSIGVTIGPFFNFSGTMDKIGVESLVVADGKNKDFLNPFRPWKPGEENALKVIAGRLYERFVHIVTEARPALDKEKLINEYGANVFLADEAQKLGYIDVADVNYKVALSDLTHAAQIAEGTPYQVVELTLPHNIFLDFANGKSPLCSGKITHHLELNSTQIDSKLQGKFLYLYHH